MPFKISIPRREMISLKSIRNPHFHALLKLQRSSNYLRNPSQNPHLSATSILPDSYEDSFRSSIFRRKFCLAAETLDNCEEKSEISLSVFFKEAVRISERRKGSGHEVGSEGENAEVKEKLRNLAGEVKNLRKVMHEVGKEKVRKEGKRRLSILDRHNDDEIKSSALVSDKEMEDSLLNPYSLLIEEVKSLNEIHERGGISELNSKKLVTEIGKRVNRSLWALFCDEEANEEVKLLKPVDFGNEDTMVHKELSPDMKMFAHHLYTEGYLREATFMTSNIFDWALFQNSYAREYLKFAAFEFGKDKPEIAKWLSASDLKKVALFGCPSLGEKSVRAAKKIRRFFKIDEHQGCEKCVLKDSCKVANKLLKNDVSKLHLGYVTRVLVMYALESVPEKLVVPDEIKESVSRLLKEVVNLSQTLS